MRAGLPTRIERPRPGIVALAVVAVATAGCSFIFVQPPREGLPDHGAAECTTVAAAPMIDLILAGANAIGTLYFAEHTTVTSNNAGPTVGVGLSIAAVWAISAIYGFRNTSRCTDLQSEPEEPIRPRRRPQ